MYSALTQLETPLIHVSRVLPTHLPSPTDEWKRVSNPIYSLANYRFISLSNFLSICRFVNTQERKHSIMKKVTSSGHLVIILIIIHLSFGLSSFLSIIGLFVCLSVCSFILSLLVLIEIWGNLKWKQKVDTKFSLQIEVSHPLTICLITRS